MIGCLKWYIILITRWRCWSILSLYDTIFPSLNEYTTRNKNPVVLFTRDITWTPGHLRRLILSSYVSKKIS